MTEENKNPKEGQEEKLVIQQNNGNNARASWPISTRNLRINCAHMAAENKQLLVGCFQWCIKHGITRYEFAKAIDYSENVIYKILTGKYLHPETKERLDLQLKMVNAMKRWLRDQEAKTELRGDFIITPTAKKVFKACELAKESRTPVFLYGPSHVGKSWALEHYANTNNHGRTLYVRLGAASGLGGMLSEIAKVVGESPGSSKEKMIQYIKGGLASDNLLILDEVHLLMHTYRKESFFACIEVIREFYDRIQLGIVLCVTKLKWDQFNEHKSRELEQVFKRGVHRFALGTKSGAPLPADIKLILDYHGLDFPKKSDRIVVEDIEEQPYEILRQLSKEEGLKSITERIRYAKILATRQKREDITWDDFVRAHLAIKFDATEAEDWT